MNRSRSCVLALLSDIERHSLERDFGSNGECTVVDGVDGPR